MGSLSDYEILKVIGKGSYGEVHLVQHKKERKQYAIKKMALHKVSKRERKAAELEAKLLSKLKHPNIVSYKDSFEHDDGYLYIVMGYAEGGDLYNRIREQRERNEYLSEVQVVRWFIQICMALQYLHQKHILHRDLKTQNIFLTKTKMVKVGDLSIARVLEGAGDMATTLIGTPYYMSPELFSNRPYNHKSDVWALGCCIYEMTTLKHAFNAKDMNALVYKILKQKMPKMPELYSSALCDLIKSMLHQNADKRPSVNRILRNSFIKKHIQLFLDESSSKSRRPTSGRSRHSESSSRRTSTSSQQSRCSSRESVGSVVEMNAPKPSQTKQKVSVKPKSPQGLAPQAASNRKSHLKVEAKSEPHYVNIQEAKSEPHYVNIQEAKSEPHYVNVQEIKDKPHCINVEGVRHQAPSSVETHKGQRNRQPVERQKPKLISKERNKIPSTRSPHPPEQELSKEELATSSTSNGSTTNKQGSDQKPLSSATREDLTESPDAVFDQNDALKASGDSTASPRGGRVSSARERRRREKQRRANEMKEAASKTADLVEVPVLTVSKENGGTTEMDGDSKRKDSSTGEEVNQFYTLLHTTLKFSSQDESPPQTPPDNVAEEAFLPSKGVRNQLSPVEELSESAASTLTERKDTPQEPSKPPTSRNTPQATDIGIRLPPNAYPSPKGISQATLGSTGRLMDRIVALRKDCIRGLGVPLLHRAYELMDGDFEEDQLQKRLIDLLGEVRFRQWAGKIWQLKFCEESIFKHCGSITAY